MNNIKRAALLLLAVLISSVNSFGQTSKTSFSIIPAPTELQPGDGFFNITPQTTISDASGKFSNEVVQLNNLIKGGLGVHLRTGAGKQSIRLVYSAALPTEGYNLQISPAGLILKASTPAGIFHGIETVRQLLPASVENGSAKLGVIKLPALAINDHPAYQWRGMHLDVSRHFFSLAYLRKYIDMMALYKMNKFHLHLTDDQGWRVEIKRYPALTAQGAWRTFNNQDTVCIKRSKDNPDMAIDPQHIIKKNGKTLYGGFYTQQELRGLVAYAASKHIEIIPEIDMPGHMMAAINSYPFLTCNGENSFGEFFSKPICPCNESTFEFAQHVYDEIMTIFPSKYIHIGGDEVERSDWAKSAACKAMMEKEGIKSLEDLHSYFINRMEKYFNSKGKKLIGWDEVIEGGISSTATIMYWRSWIPDAPVKAAKNGNPVIMTPGDPLYFDRQPDEHTLSQVYHFNPIPASLTGKETKAIIGAQANVWTEYIPTEARADYMVMPRMTALAERLWTNAPDNFDDYLQRLQKQYPRLDVMGVHYRLPDLPGIITENVFINKAELKVQQPMAGLTLRYTTDGSLPSVTSKTLNGSLLISTPQVVKLAAFGHNGLRGDVYTLNYKKETLPAPVNVQTTVGLKIDYYGGKFKKTALMDGARSDSSAIVDSIIVPSTIKSPAFGLRYSGYIDVPASGIYTFFLTCDDGGVLRIAGRLVIDNDGNHSAIEKNGQVALGKGLQPFNLDFLEAGGGYKLELKYSVDGSAPQDIPTNWLRH